MHTCTCIRTAWNTKIIEYIFVFMSSMYNYNINATKWPRYTECRTRYSKKLLDTLRNFRSMQMWQFSCSMVCACVHVLMHSLVNALVNARALSLHTHARTTLQPSLVIKGALGSRVGISRGTPNTKRCFRNSIECATGAVEHSIGLRNHRLLFLPGYTERPTWTSAGKLEISSVYRGTSRPCKSSAPIVSSLPRV